MGNHWPRCSRSHTPGLWIKAHRITSWLNWKWLQTSIIWSRLCIMWELSNQKRHSWGRTNALEVPYIIAEAPSNLLLKGVRPSIWQARIMVRWTITPLARLALTVTDILGYRSLLSCRCVKQTGSICRPILSRTIRGWPMARNALAVMLLV